MSERSKELLLEVFVWVLVSLVLFAGACFVMPIKGAVCVALQFLVVCACLRWSCEHGYRTAIKVYKKKGCCRME